MATKIETLKKPNGDYVLPRTRAKAVFLENGTTTESAIEDIYSMIANLPVYEGTYREIYTGEVEDV